MNKDTSKREANPIVEEPNSKTEHALQHASTRYICTRCHSGLSSRDPQFKHWLDLPCKLEIVKYTNRPNPLSGIETSHIGNETVHSSHELRHHRALVYCNVVASLGVLKCAICETPANLQEDIANAVCRL